MTCIMYICNHVIYCILYPYLCLCLYHAHVCVYAHIHIYVHIHVYVQIMSICYQYNHIIVFIFKTLHILAIACPTQWVLLASVSCLRFEEHHGRNFRQSGSLIGMTPCCPPAGFLSRLAAQTSSKVHLSDPLSLVLKLTCSVSPKTSLVRAGWMDLVI